MPWSRRHRLLPAVLATAAAPLLTAQQPGAHFALYTDASRSTPGLVGSYVDSNLAHVSAPDDWRTTQVVAGTRVDPEIEFLLPGWGVRAQVGLTGGSDTNWDQYSVQWDGVVEVLAPGVQLATRSDDSSRMWIDLDGDQSFLHAPPELVDNHWGSPQGMTLGDLSPPLPVGTYRIRIQFEERFGGNAIALEDFAAPSVRIAYLVPQDRSARPHAVANLRHMAGLWQQWLCEQTDRHDLGARRLRLETEANGATVKVHVVSVAATAAQLRTDLWGQVLQAAGNAGLPLWQRGQVWLLVPECHEQLPDGTVQGQVALGAGFGSGDDGGVAVVGSAALPLAGPGGLTDTRRYAGLVVPEIGPYPLVQGVSFPGFEGDTVSSVVSSFTGAALHELAHALGVPHDWRNDGNFHGNLMYNGLRGLRGAIHPALFPGEDTRLGRAAALLLANSRYLERCDGLPPPAGTADDVRPSVAVLTQGAVTVQNGLLSITASAQDDRELAALVLDRAGDVIDEREASGTAAVVTFATPWYEPGIAHDFGVTVVDRAGNRERAQVSITALAPSGRAPHPFFRVDPSSVAATGTAQLDASLSSDPEGAALLFEWDLDGDGVFETPPTSSPMRSVSWPEPWPRQVRVRVTDPAGMQAISAPIAVRARAAAEGAYLASYGSGSAGCGGPVQLRGNLPPGLGTAAFGLASRYAPPSALGAVLLSLAQPSGCTAVPGLPGLCLWLDPARIAASVVVVADAQGRHFYALPISGDPAYRGLSIRAQTVWWPSATGCTGAGLSTSNGLRLTIL